MQIANVTTWLVLDSGGNAKQCPAHSSTNRHRQPADLGGWCSIANRANAMVADSWATPLTAHRAGGWPAMAATTGSGGSAAWANGRYQIINRGTGTALDGMGNTTAGSTASM